MQWVIMWTRHLSGFVNQRERESQRKTEKQRQTDTDIQTDRQETERHGKWGGRDTQSDSERVVKEMARERQRQRTRANR